MKEIRMLLAEYEDDKKDNYSAGYIDGTENGISLVMKWLESGTRLYDFLIEKGYLLPKVSSSTLQGLHWGRIAKCLGREEEVTLKQEKGEING